MRAHRSRCGAACAWEDSSRRLLERAAVGLFAAALLFAATPAAADTIYLKNGRILHTAELTVEGDTVTFRQYGGIVTIPMSRVERIERNERQGPDATPTTDPAELATAAQADEDAAGQAASGDEGASGDEPDTAAAPDDPNAPPEPPGPDTREYWRDRLDPLFEQMDEVEDQLDRWRPLATSSAEAARRVEELEDRLSDLEGQVEAIRRDGRRQGVPSGWLRR